MARWRQKAARMRTPSPGTERRENPTKRWRWASDRGRDKWGSRRARQTGNPSKPGHCPETLLLLLLLSPRKGESRSEDPAQARPAATRLQAVLRALLAAILALGSHLTAGGPSQHPRNATTAGPRHAQLSSRTKGRDTRNLDPGSEAEEPALRQGQLWPGPHHPAQAAPPSPSWPVPSGMGREGRG